MFLCHFKLNKTTETFICHILFVKFFTAAVKRPGLEVIKLFSCSTQLSMKFIFLIIVGILTFISMINTRSEWLKGRNFFICQYFSVYEQLKFRAQLS